MAADFDTPTRGSAALTVLPGDGMSADDAAWLTVAEAAEQARRTPGLSSASASELAELHRAALRCARQAVA